MSHESDASLFSTIEMNRYSRHFLLSNVGIEGQTKFKNGRVICVGAGALGSVVLPIITSAGIGKIGIVDDDTIELSNLQRQTLYCTNEVGQYKVKIAQQRLEAINPDISITAYRERMDINNAIALIKEYDYVIDCTDNIATRYLLSAVCTLQKTPYLYGGINQFVGQCSVLVAANAPCYHCLFPNSPPSDALPNCAQAGVLSSLPGIIGALQANELFKLILGIGTPLIGKLLNIDALSMSFQYFDIAKRQDCENCGKNIRKPLAELIKQPATCSMEHEFEITAQEAQSAYELTALNLLDVREHYERKTDHIGGNHIPLAALPNSIDLIRTFNQPVLVYCASGKRSLQAVQLLRKQNIISYSLKGGMHTWLTIS